MKDIIRTTVISLLTVLACIVVSDITAYGRKITPLTVVNYEDNPVPVDLQNFPFPKRNSKAGSEEILHAGGRTVGGPAIQTCVNIGDHGPVMSNKMSTEINICVSVTHLEGTGIAELHSSNSGKLAAIIPGGSETVCVTLPPGELIVLRQEQAEGFTVVWRIDTYDN